MATKKWDVGGIRLDLGGEILSLVPATDDVHLRVEDRLKPFLSTAGPIMRLNVHCTHAPSQNEGELIFDSGGMWRLERVHDKLALGLYSRASGLAQVIVLEPDLCAHS